MRKATLFFILALLGGVSLFLLYRPIEPEQPDSSPPDNRQKHSSKTATPPVATPPVATPPVATPPVANPVVGKNDPSTGQTEKSKKVAKDILLGTQVFSLMFPQSSPSDKLKQLMKQDIELLFAHLGEPTLTKLNVEGNINPNVPTHGLSFDARGRYWPKAISDHFFSVNVTGKESALIISEPLIAAYEDAITMTSAHEVALRALPVFLEKINSNTDSTGWTADEVKRTMYAPTPEYAALTVDQLRAAVDQLMQLKLREPSILGFAEVDVNGENVLAVKTLASDASVDPTFYEELTLVFDQDHWSVAP